MNENQKFLTNRKSMKKKTTDFINYVTRIKTNNKKYLCLNFAEEFVKFYFDIICRAQHIDIHTQPIEMQFCKIFTCTHSHMYIHANRMRRLSANSGRIDQTKA